MHLHWPHVHDSLRPSGAPWQRGPSFEAIAAAGAHATDDDIARLIPDLLTGASEPLVEANISAKPGTAARRALATILCGITRKDFDQALKEVIHETETTPYPPACTIQALLLATDAGLCDTTVL